MVVVEQRKTLHQVDGKNLEEVNGVTCQGN